MTDTEVERLNRMIIILRSDFDSVAAAHNSKVITISRLTDKIAAAEAELCSTGDDVRRIGKTLEILRSNASESSVD